MRNRLRMSLMALCALVLTGSQAMAQNINNYAFSTATNGSLDLDRNANVINMASGTTEVVAAASDNGTSGVLTIGFPFTFMGVEYTQWSTSANGIIRLGGTALAGATYGLNQANQPLLAAFGGDLITATTIGKVHYKLVGTAPNRCLVVEWLNVGLDWTTGPVGDGTFQARLYETTGIVEYVYGSMYRNNSAVNSPAYTFNVGMSTNTTPTTIVSVNTATEALSNALFVNVYTISTNIPNLHSTTNGSRKVYTFTPPVPAPPTAMTFTAVTATSMTVGWTDNSVGESGFLVQRSLDGITYTNVGNVPSTSGPATGATYTLPQTLLSNSTLYYYRIYAISEGATSATALSGSQATLPGSMCGVITVGPTGTYTSLTAAFADLALNSVSCPVIFELQSAYVSSVETFPISVPFYGGSSTNNVTVRPETGATNLSITSANATATISLNGASYLTFDGRPGGLGTVKHLTISNTNVAGSTVVFQNNSHNNGLTYTLVDGVNNTATGAVILFGNSPAGISPGNSQNSITFSEISDGATTPNNLILSTNATAGASGNNGNIIENNLLRNFFNAGAVSYGIRLTTNNSGWNIATNSIYQTTPRTYTTASTHAAISINAPGGSGFVINANAIGGTAPSNGGTAYTMTGAIATRFIGIDYNSTGANASVIVGNTISNFDLATSSGASSANGVWCGINSAGSTPITITNNTIGSSTTPSVHVVSTTGGAWTVGINSSATGTTTIVTNTIGGIIAEGSAPAQGSFIKGILNSGGAVTISSNTVGGTVAGSITAGNNGTTAACSTTGIENSSALAVTITGNTIQNHTALGTGTGTSRGILSTAGVTPLIAGNTIHDISTNSTATGITFNSYAVSGINTSASTGQQILSNTIYNLFVNTTGATSTHVAGMSFGTSTSTGTLGANKIYDLFNASTGATSSIIGIHGYWGDFTASNNMVSLTNGVNTNPVIIRGIFDESGSGRTWNYYHNTVYVGGSAGSGALNSYAFVRNVATAVTIKNNFFYNERTGGTGFHYAIGNIHTAPATGWSAGVSDNNFIVTADANTVGEWGVGVSRNLVQWRTSSAGDLLTNSELNTGMASATIFVNTAVANLKINPAYYLTPSKLESKGIVIGSVTTDLEGDVRPGPAGSLNGGGLAPDIGADEFDGVPLLIDMGALTIVNPVQGCLTSSENVRVRIRNYSVQPINFAVNPVTVTVLSTGLNPIVFPPITINTGTLGAGTNLDTLVATGYNMSAVGTYTFKAVTSVIDDSNTGNDSMAVVTRTTSLGTVTSDATSPLCAYSSVNLTVAGQTIGGTLQWQESADGGTTWTNLAGGTTNPFTVTVLDTTFYRVVVCGTQNSNAISIDPVVIGTPVINDTTRCGPGTMTLQASVNPGTFAAWYANPVGGQPLDTGSTYTTPLLTVTDTFYVSGAGGAIVTIDTVGLINTAGYSFLTQTAGWGAMFTANLACTLDSVGVYPTGTGTITIHVTDLANNILFSGPVTNISGTGTQKIMVPVGAALTPGNYKLGMNSTGVTNLGSQNTGSTMGYPFVSPALTITSGSQGAGPVAAVYYWFYDWRVSTGGGCQSPRVPVIVTVTPSDNINAVAVTNPICSNTSTQITVSSANAGYVYDWSPATGLSATTGPVVTAGPDSTVTYNIHAINNTSLCEALTQITVNVNAAPVVNAIPTDTTLCFGEPLQLNAMAVSTDTSYIAGFGTATNTATATGACGPYGGYYGGTKQQYLVRASELTSAGMTAGPINYIGFDISALNGIDTLMDYSIKMDSTSLTALTSTFVPSLPTVHYTAEYMPTSTGWTEHTVNGFNWNGVSNVIVEICFNNNSGGYTNGNASVRYTSNPGHMVYYSADNISALCANLTGTVSGNRPNIRFGRTAPMDFQWNPATGLNSDTIADPIAIVGASGDYIVLVTDEFNNCSTQDTVSVIVNPQPQLDLGTDTAICSNGLGFFLDASGPGLSYVWQDSSSAPTFFVSEPGTYIVAVTDGNTCRNMDTVIVTEVDPIQVNISTSIMTPNTAILDAGAGFSSYFWSNFANTSSINVTGNGTYWVQVVDANGCISTDTTTIIFFLGINEDGKNTTLQYYPNPSNGVFTMDVKGFQPGDMQVEIVDMNGRPVYSHLIKNAAESFKHPVDISNVAGGTYFVRITSQNGSFTNRIVIATK